MRQVEMRILNLFLMAQAFAKESLASELSGEVPNIARLPKENLMMALASQCPDSCLHDFNNLAAVVPEGHRGAFGEILKKALALGISWIAIVKFLATHANLLVKLFATGLSVDEIVQLIQDAIALIPQG